MIKALLPSIIVPLFLSLLLTPLARWLGRKWGIMDIPAQRRVHTVPTPKTGGWAIFIAFIISALVFTKPTGSILGLLIAASFIFVVEISDDIHELPAVTKFLSQIVAAGILISFGVSATIFPKIWWGHALNYTLTILWLVGITNAVNFIDGMDGLAAGLCIIFSCLFSIVFLQMGAFSMVPFCLFILGACIGFIPYNFRGEGRGATIFLGDTGSNFLGFILAALAIMAEWSEDMLLPSLAAPLLIFAVVIYDMAYINLRRIIMGEVSTIRELMEYTGKDHLHHRLHYLLGSKTKTVLTIYLLAIALGMNALLIKMAPDYFWVLLLQALVILSFATILEIAATLKMKREERASEGLTTHNKAR
ncbi:MAG: undecaprenyl/decaprenyl-phosphate alpha-N-acetylglucosaminyl 1-phosphate transferase [Deltaproteobacteria bacterium]|nr:undecaprenyl/decaprenyl-phosphate alpha-N-acetylglucosaminyl 1-phosphate transferase [Deltaproteobacteria bacterium]